MKRNLRFQTKYKMLNLKTFLETFTFYEISAEVSHLLLHLKNTSYELSTQLDREKTSTSFCEFSGRIKDVRLVETKLEDFAIKTLEDISDYFLQLHSFLQNKEKQILDNFSEICHQPQFQLRQAYVKLNESQETLNVMRANLEFYHHKLPSDIHVGKIVEKYNDQLVQMPCEIHITQPLANPFTFETKQDIRQDMDKYIKYYYTDPQLTIEINALNDDSNQSLLDTSGLHSSMDISYGTMASNINKPQQLQEYHQQKCKSKKKQPKKTHTRLHNDDIEMLASGSSVGSLSGTSDRNMHRTHDDNIVRVTHVKSPEHFYVQKVNDLGKIRELSHTYHDCADGDRIPKSLSVGYYYMVYHVTDKQWYRSMLKKILPNEVYKVFLVDFGVHLEILRDKLCDIQENDLKIPFAAVRCAISDIVPVGKYWTEEANNLLIELLQNKPARISIIEKIGNEMLKVDLHTHQTKSVRDSFLYTGLARERPGAHSFKMQIKKTSSTIKSEDRIGRNYFHVGKILMVNVLHIEGPHEFYVIKDDDLEDKHNLVRDLNTHYGPTDTKHQQIYLASVQMCCAVCLDGTWHRAVIEEIKDRGSLVIRMVDEGRRKIINWRQIFVLEEEFRKRREFAIRCALADIEPLQENSYVYTSSAIKDFKQMTVNPYLRMEIHSIKEYEYRVLLYVSKRNLDINIGAALVKNRHGVSTGETTQIMEFVKLSKTHSSLVGVKPTQGLNLDEQLKNATATLINVKSAKEQVKEPLKRSPVIVTHLVDPGEFYVQLVSLVKGTNEFHSKIQETQNKKYPSLANSIELPPREKRQWLVGNHCLVYSKYECPPVSSTPLRNCEWYRGVITNTTHGPGSEPTFSVFLRDIGATIRSIAAHQLVSIDAQLDRVTNAVYCCYLASIKPTGGVTSWSHSAIDYFRYAVETFESLSVSLKGKRSEATSSLPVVLWGSMTETADPLAPCITKYSNISRMLVDMGLAHMMEPLDVTHHFDKIEEMALKDGEISLQEWFKLFEDNALLNAIEDKEQYPGSILDDCNFTIDDIGDNVTDADSLEYNPLSIYLKEVDVTPTTGRKAAPQAWGISKDINRTLFTGYATYVDFGCVVYLHEANDKPFLERMCKIVSETYEHLPQPQAEYEYVKNQPCIARYHLDSKFYRAVVEKTANDKGEWRIRFVDYGNIESVESKDIRPYAPFPNLPSLANKYVISGIQPNNAVDDLDQMHGYLVGKFVSVRLAHCELTNTVKKCSMRLGTEDVASFFIKKRWATRETIPPTPQTVMGSGSETNRSRKTRNPLPEDGSEDGYAVFDRHIDDKNSNENNGSSDEAVNRNWFMQSKGKLDHFNNLIERLDSNRPKSNAVATVNIVPSAIQQPQSVSVTSPPKKRMFNRNVYAQMMNGDMALDSDDDILKDEAFYLDGDDDEGVVEMSYSFSMNYWHSDMNPEEEREIGQQLERRIALQEDEEIESEFENFRPNDASTVFSHFSGIEVFKLPQFPAGIVIFTCRVISIITSTVLQIFPTKIEFEKRDVDMQHAIRHAAKSAPLLTHFEPRTICLACYSRDKKWYRAIIRSFNQIAKTVEVLYVDYLNSETLPLKYVRQCPAEVLGWPLRTFRVRLNGIEPNPNINDYQIRQALHKALAKQSLLAVVKKYASNQKPVNHTDQFCSVPSGAYASQITDHDLMEISLYKSQDLLSKGLTVYESLIERSFFLRI